MCGIAGFTRLTRNEPLPLELLYQMAEVQSHRGPDGSGFYIDDWTGMGHTRLSIIDLAGGAQPICNEDGTLWIIFNGEIFNYIELRQDLSGKGHCFTTSTDTEVILHLYEDYRQDCLKFLNGQFAIAIWDNVKKELFLARDRVGIRPLHYTICDGVLLFASEIKSIFQWQNVSREIDPIGIDQIFTFWTPLPGHTAFRGVQELPSGHYLKISERRIAVKKYWEPSFCRVEDQLDWTIDEICEKAQDLIMDSTRIRLRADVPVGSYLSGGLDSSAITEVVKRNFNNKLITYGIHFEEPSFDETEFQDLMTSYLGVEHKYITATNRSIGDFFPDVVWHCEKPLLRTAPAPLCMLSRLVRDSGFKVVLSGEGADEIFCGYNIFREAKVRSFWARQPESKIRPLLINKLYPYIFGNIGGKSTIQKFFAAGMEDVDNPFYSHEIRWKTTSRIKAFLDDEFSRQIEPEGSYHQLRASLPPTFYSWDFLAKAQYLEMILFLSNYLLSSQGDRMAMKNSVEMRMPYLDYRIIDFMGRVPSKWKLQGLCEKYILKKVFKERLPEKILKRPKHPYRAPIKESLLHFNSTCSESISYIKLRESGIFNPSKVEKLIQKVNSGRYVGEFDNMALTGIISTQILYEKFVKDFNVSSGSIINIQKVIDRRSVGTI